jgi:hypothetical protein
VAVYFIFVVLAQHDHGPEISPVRQPFPLNTDILGGAKLDGVAAAWAFEVAP